MVYARLAIVQQILLVKIGIILKRQLAPPKVTHY